MMSLEEEKMEEDGDRCFVAKPLPFRTKKYKKVIDLADTLMENNESQRAKELKMKRKTGSPSKRQPPKKLKILR